MIDDPDRPAWTGNFFVGMPAPAGAITVLLPIYPAFLGLPRSGFLTWLTLFYTLGDRFADGVAAAGVFRQACRHPGAAGNGRSADRAGGARSIALLIAYPWVLLTAGTLAYLASLPFGWLSYRGYERRSRESRGAAPMRRSRRRFADDRARSSVGRRRPPVASQLSADRRRGLNDREGSRRCVLPGVALWSRRWRRWRPPP